MPDQLQLRGGTTVQHSTFTGSSKEVTVDTTKKTAVVHDGSTVGGNPLMREDASNSALALGSAAAPSLKWDANTGIYSPGADQVAVATNGTGRLFVNSNGDIGLGTSSPDPFARFYTRNIGLSSSGSTSLQINAATGSNAIIDLGVNSARTAGITSNVSETQFTTLTATPILVGTNGGERVRITSAGLVGIGASAPSSKLDVTVPVNIPSTGSPDAGSFITARGNTTSVGYGPSFSLSNSSGVKETFWRISAVTASGNNGDLVFNGYNGGADYPERLRITAGGLVGIGSTAPQAKLHVNTGTNENLYVGSLGGSGAGVYLAAVNDSGSANIPLNIGSASNIRFAINGTEAARIDSSRRLLVGTSTVLTSGFVSIQFDGNAYNGITLKTTYASNASNYLAFTGSGGALAGYIQQTGSTTVSYVTTSDYRLKENVSLIGDSITRLQQLKPRRFNFISEPDRIVDGFLAHEAQDIVPEAITGEKDAVDADGNPVFQGIDQSKLVPLLTAALQEAIAKIETLEQRLTAAGID
jgi:hypothetical protein